LDIMLGFWLIWILAKCIDTRLCILDLEYENLPEVSIHCKMIGHYVEIARRFMG
jgi:hypothetical protein